jgi:hypothetical protein
MGQEVHCHEENSIHAANASTASHFAAIGLKKGDVSALSSPRTMTGGMLYEGLRIWRYAVAPSCLHHESEN